MVFGKNDDVLTRAHSNRVMNTSNCTKLQYGLLRDLFQEIRFDDAGQRDLAVNNRAFNGRERPITTC